MVSRNISSQPAVSFENPFHIDDLSVFDTETIHSMLVCGRTILTAQSLAHSMHGVSAALIAHVRQSLPVDQQSFFQQELQRPLSLEEIADAQRHVLNNLFWELIYWKMPELYEELTEGEYLHPGIFQSIKADLQGKTVLDAGAGSGRATLDCVYCGASSVYAVEPSPGLLRLLRKKIIDRGVQQRVIPAAGRFESLPLHDHSVDTTISCSAFTVIDDQGGELGLAEMKRVTKPGGKIIIIWPRTADHAWLVSHGFHYVSLCMENTMYVHFRSLQSAFDCARLFYAHNAKVMQYLQCTQQPDIPFSVIGMNPPRDYFWLVNPSDV